MVKAPILSPTPPSSTSLSPTNEDQQVALLTGASTKSTLSTATEVTGLPATTSSSSEDQNATSKVKIRINDLVMADSGPMISAAAKQEGEKDSGVDETDYRTAVRNGSGRGGGDSVHLVASKSISSSTTSISSNEFRSSKMSENPKTGVPVSSSGSALQYGTPITVASAPLQPQASLQQTGATGQQQQQQQQQIPQIPPSQAPPPPPPGPHHPHHHLFPVHVISIPQPHPGTAAAAAVTGAWPLVEAPIYVDSNGEPRHYCPAHSQGPAPREHRVLLQLDAGVSLPLQIAGKRKVFRGECPLS